MSDKFVIRGDALTASEVDFQGKSVSIGEEYLMSEMRTIQHRYLNRVIPLRSGHPRHLILNRNSDESWR
jgi:hypothetical protein